MELFYVPILKVLYIYIFGLKIATKMAGESFGKLVVNFP